MSPKHKAQTAFEFVMMGALAIVIAGVFLASLAGLISDAAEHERLAAINTLGYAIQDEVILATLVHDGYERAFVVPSSAGRFTYSISSTATGVTLSSGQLTITYPIPEISGDIGKGENTIRNGAQVIVT